MLTFYFVRHGAKEPMPFDPPLTSLGQRQSELTATHLKAIPFLEIVASPKLRTKQTADYIAQALNTTVSYDERLQERLEWEENKSFDEFMAEWNKTSIDRKYKPISGFSSWEKGHHMREVVNDLAEKHAEGNILIITHGGSIGDLLQALFAEEELPFVKDTVSGAPYIVVHECSITTIQSSEKGFLLKDINTTDHLLEVTSCWK